MKTLFESTIREYTPRQDTPRTGYSICAMAEDCPRIMKDSKHCFEFCTNPARVSLCPELDATLLLDEMSAQRLCRLNQLNLMNVEPQ